MSSLKLQIKLLEHLLVLDGPLVELLLLARAHCLVGQVVQLGQGEVVQSLLDVPLRDGIDGSDLLLECDNILHHLASDLLVLHSLDDLLVLIDLLVKSHNVLVDLLPSCELLFLQVLHHGE